MPKCAKFPLLEGRPTLLPGNFEIYLSDQGRNLWMEFIRPLSQWATYRRAEQKLNAAQLRQSAATSDLTNDIVDREYWFRKAEEAMFDVAKKWADSGPVKDA